MEGVASEGAAGAGASDVATAAGAVVAVAMLTLSDDELLLVCAAEAGVGDDDSIRLVGRPGGGVRRDASAAAGEMTGGLAGVGRSTKAPSADRSGEEMVC